MKTFSARVGSAAFFFAAMALAHALPVSAQGLTAEYYNSGGGTAPAPPQGSPAGGATANPPADTQTDANIDFGFPTPPSTNTLNDGFMVAWTGEFNVTTAGAYTFRVRSDDGCRMWLDGNATAIIDSWVDQGPTDHDSAAIMLAAGPHEIRIEFYENGGGEECRFSYSGPDDMNVMTIVPTGKLNPPIIPGSASGLTANGAPSMVGPQVVLNWTAGANALSYTVERGLAMGGPFSAVATNVMGTTYTDTAVAYNVTYFYRVIAVRGSQTAAPSNVVQVTTLPPPPKTTSTGGNNNVWHRCGCDTAGMASGAALHGAIALLALGVIFLRRR